MASETRDLKIAEASSNIIIENRTKLNISGVEDVLSFDERRVEAYTSGGLLVVAGIDLHIESLSLDSGDLFITGQIDSVIYAEDYAPKQGFWASLFK